MAKLFGDKWEVIKDMRGGGQSYVYLVKDKRVGDNGEYVLKKLKNPDRLERFAREIEVIKKIKSKRKVHLSG